MCKQYILYIVHVYSVYKYNALTEEEIVMAVSRLDEEDDELIADKSAIPFAYSGWRHKPTVIQ